MLISLLLLLLLLLLMKPLSKVPLKNFFVTIYQKMLHGIIIVWFHV